MRLARESVFLASICLADLAYTVWLLLHGVAVEANPVLAFYLSKGIAWFVLAKLFLIASPIVGIEWVRIRKPQFVCRMLRLGIALYVGLYAYGVWRINEKHDSSPVAIASLALRP